MASDPPSSLIRLEAGRRGGVFTAVTETTNRVIGDRRLRNAPRPAADAAGCKTVEEASGATMGTLANNAADVPFAMLYLFSKDGRESPALKKQPYRAELAGDPAAPDASPSSCRNESIIFPAKSLRQRCFIGLACAIETLKGFLAFLSMIDEWRRIIFGKTIGWRLRESHWIHIS